MVDECLQLPSINIENIESEQFLFVCLLVSTVAMDEITINPHLPPSLIRRIFQTVLTLAFGRLCAQSMEIFS